MAPTTGGATTLALVSVSAVLAIAAALYWRQRRATAFVARKRAAKSRLPPTIIISLARLPVARKGALKRADEAGLERVSIFDAVDGRTLSTKELDHRQVSVYSGWRLGSSGFRFFDRELKWGEVGCALSHIGVWSQVAAMEEDDVALVIEDDVEFVPAFVERLRGVLAEIAALVREGVIHEPDACYLCRKAMRPELDHVLPRSRSHVATMTDGDIPPTPKLLIPGFSYKTTAYLLWQRGARKLLASDLERKLIPVDDFLALTYAKHEAKAGIARPDLDSLFAAAPRLNMLAVQPQLCRERRGVSATENSPLITMRAAGGEPRRIPH